jgi:hypothetical protein
LLLLALLLLQLQPGKAAGLLPCCHPYLLQTRASGTPSLPLLLLLLLLAVLQMLLQDQQH